MGAVNRILQTDRDRGARNQWLRFFKMRTLMFVLRPSARPLFPSELLVDLLGWFQRAGQQSCHSGVRWGRRKAIASSHPVEKRCQCELISTKCISVSLGMDLALPSQIGIAQVTHLVGNISISLMASSKTGGADTHDGKIGL